MLPRTGPIIDHLIGVPWRRLGMSPEDGFSCYGLVRYLYAQVGDPLPEDIHDAAGLMRYLARYEGVPTTAPHGASHLFDQVDPPYRPYDVLVFRNVGTLIRHLGLMLDARWFVHCCPVTNGVARSELARWQRLLRYGVRRHTCISA
jgi:cell wall-associated NlpC family hydrolase